MQEISTIALEEHKDSKEKNKGPAIREKGPIAGNTATGTLKLIALILMVIDHTGAIFFTAATGNYIPQLRIIGRLAFPLYAWCMVVGATYTRHMPRYLLRLLAVGAVSQVTYHLALHHEWLELNIYATLLLALLGIWGIREKRFGSQVWAPVLAVLTTTVIHVDYGFQGVLFIILMYLCREKRGTLCAFMIAYCLFWGYTSGSALNTAFGITLPKTVSFMPNGGKLLASIFRMQFCAVLALPLMLIKMPNIRLPKWLGYAAYPAHLLVLWGIRLMLGI